MALHKGTTVSCNGKPIGKCFACGSQDFFIPHPDRKHKQHPFPDNSFLCTNHREDRDVKGLGMPVVVCDDCGDPMCEWWYSNKEIWEDLFPVGDSIYCQSCYYDNNHREDYSSESE
jgi:hypothetical protein